MHECMHVYTNVYIYYIYMSIHMCVCGLFAPRSSRRPSDRHRPRASMRHSCAPHEGRWRRSCKVLHAFFSKVYVGFSGFVGFRILWVYAVVLWRFLVSGSRAHCLSVCLSSYISIYQLPTYLPIYLFYLSICIYPSCVQSCMFAALRILRFGKSRDQSFVV